MPVVPSWIGLKTIVAKDLLDVIIARVSVSALIWDRSWFATISISDGQVFVTGVKGPAAPLPAPLVSSSPYSEISRKFVK